MKISDEVVQMHDHMHERLTELKDEFRSGEAQLRELGRQEAVLRETLLRISGAIQVLEELLEHDSKGSGNGEGAPEGIPVPPPARTETRNGTDDAPVEGQTLTVP